MTRALRPTLVIVALVATSACAKPWNTANTALEATAQAVVATDEMVAENMTEDHEAARARVVEAARAALAEWEACEADESRDDCGDRPTVAQFMEQYDEDERVQTWGTVTLALEELREALIVAQAAVGVWRDTQEQPGNWSVICEGLDTTRGAVIRAIEAAGVEVPDQYERMSEYLLPVCNLIVNVTAGD